MPAFAGFPKRTATFLRGLTKNNDKAWFDARRADYDASYVEPAKSFVAAIGPRLQKISPTVDFAPKVNGSLFRVNRDVRFAKDKSPYKNHIDLWFWHGARRGWGAPGFYFRMFADHLILGSGMHKFEKTQLDAYRRAVADDEAGEALAETLEKVRAAGLYEIGGDTRKTVPRGFRPSHPRAALLLHEGLHASINTKAGRVVETPEFVDYCLGHFEAMWPISKWLLENVAGEQSAKPAPRKAPTTAKKPAPRKKPTPVKMPPTRKASAKPTARKKPIPAKKPTPRKKPAARKRKAAAS